MLNFSSAIKVSTENKKAKRKAWLGLSGGFGYELIEAFELP